MKAIITQSNYIPWKGYFDAIALADVFVVFDEMQYTRRDWRNRNIIKTSSGKKWLTIPVDVKGKYFQKINETKVAEKKWGVSHWGAIRQNYSNSPFYKEVSEWLEAIYLNHSSDYLSVVNIEFINAINKYLGINTKILFSKDFDLVSDKTQRLVDICSKLSVTEYYTGNAAKNYMDESKFAKENISVKYFKYQNYPEYPQNFPPFDHQVTILDLLFNTGKDAKKYMKHLT